MAKGKHSGGAGAPYYQTPGGLITPIVGFSSSAGLGTPPKPSRRGEPKAPGTGQIPTGGSGGGEGSRAVSQAFGFKKGGRK